MAAGGHPPRVCRPGGAPPAPGQQRDDPLGARDGKTMNDAPPPAGSGRRHARAEKQSTHTERSNSGSSHLG
eukprot:10149000-Alexandrium_andersonii.AAC.1